MAKKSVKSPKAPKAPKKPPGKSYLSVYLDGTLKVRLTAVAKKRDMSASKLAAVLISEGIDDHAEMGEFLTDPKVRSGLRYLLKHPDALNALMAANEMQPNQQNLSALFDDGQEEE